MALTSADRQKRYRAHKRGDHSLCDPSRRCDVTDAVEQVEAEPFGARGTRLWADVTALGDLGPAHLVVLEEACRLADRLDVLDEFLRGRGDTWLTFQSGNADGSVVKVVVDKALAESRQQAIALKQLVTELRQVAGKAEPEREASGSDELARRREERRRAAGL